MVVLSDRFWRSEFGGNTDVIGRTLKLNDEPYTIVGVMPASASVASWTAMASDIWVPLALNDRASRGNHNLDGVARLNRDVDLAQAQSEMDAISARLAREFPKSDGRWGAVIVPMQEAIVGNSRTMLLMLLGAVGLVLLIACANAGNLLFTRALSRRKEIAIRSALGAGRSRVFQQLLVEALLLAAAGGALGLLLAYGTLASASALLASQLPRAEEISIDARVLLFALGVSILTGMLAGTCRRCAPAGPTSTTPSRKAGAATARSGSARAALLIVCEVALSLVLLMGAGVMVQSLLALRHGDTGFDPNNVLTMDMRLVGPRYPTPARRLSFFDAALQRIRALPGVEAAGTIDDLPLEEGSSQTLDLEGYPPQRDPAAVQVRQITPGYLRAMRIPVLRGRDIVEGDAEVLLVSQDAAKLYWGTDDPIGRRAALPYRRRCFGRSSESWATSSSGISMKPPRPRCTSTRVSLWQGHVRHTDVGAARHARPACRCGDPRDRSGAAGRRDPDDGAMGRRAADAAALQRAAARSLCGGRAAARRGRNLQRALVHRARTQPRDRDQNRAWRADHPTSFVW